MSKNIFVLSVMVLSRALNGMESLSTEQKPERAFRVMTYNVCSLVCMKVAKPEMLEGLSFWDRKDKIVKLIKDENADLIGFQEIKNEKNRSAFVDLYQALWPLGYELVQFKTNPGPDGFINVIAYKSAKFALDATDRWWVSETPEQFSDTWGNCFGRVALMATFYPVVWKAIKNKQVPCPDYENGPIYHVNVHPGLTHKERMESNRILIEQVKKLTQHKPGVVVVTGDFNSFPDDGGAEEITVLTDAGYDPVLKDLKTAKGVPLSGTFEGFEYDLYKSPKGKMGSQVDHVFIQVPKGYSYTSSCHVNPKRYDGTDREDAKTEYELLTGPNDEDLRDKQPSDHLPGIVDLKIFKN